jgi:hypothetical protein
MHSLVDLQAGQVNNCANLSEKVHPNDAIYLETIIHPADLNLEIGDLKFTDVGPECPTIGAPRFLEFRDWYGTRTIRVPGLRDEVECNFSWQ